MNYGFNFTIRPFSNLGKRDSREGGHKTEDVDKFLSRVRKQAKL